MGAMTLALTMGALSALSSVDRTMQQNRQAEYNKNLARAQAQAARNQAEAAQVKGRIEAENRDRERNELTRRYADQQAGNVAGFGALGVDMSSGSAQRLLSGNASRYAQAVGENRYQKALGEWETRENVRANLTSAANYDAQASWYDSTVQGLGSTLLTAGLSGLTSGLGTYAAAGGFGGGAAADTAGAATTWDRLRGNTISMRSASGRWSRPLQYR